MGMEMMHISSISACENVGVLCVGNDLEITAHYDTRKYMPMMNADGTLVLVMESRLFCHDWMSGLPTSYPTRVGPCANTRIKSTCMVTEP
jgi:hypothetical protein